MEQKQFAEAVVERNADAMAMIGDSLFQFGELGMQETESVKFMKSTLENIRLPRSNSAVPACRPTSGRIGARAIR